MKPNLNSCSTGACEGFTVLGKVPSHHQSLRELCSGLLENMQLFIPMCLQLGQGAEVGGPDGQKTS